MEKNELLKEWTKKLLMELNEANGPTPEMVVEKILSNVYDVGFEAGKDAQKLERQLEMTPPWTDGD